MSILKTIQQLGAEAYVYCTDFTINLANLTDTSYYEVNFFFFCVLYPLLLIGLPAVTFMLKVRLRALNNKMNKL